MKDLTEDEQARILEAAQKAVKRAYAPYSKFRVGAAVLTDSGNVFTGCNVENSSYGVSICAERTAIFKAVSEEGGNYMGIRAIAVVNEDGSYCPPCGACRQVILEFGADALVIFQGGSGLMQVRAKDMLPEGFISVSMLKLARNLSFSVVKTLIKE